MNGIKPFGRALPDGDGRRLQGFGHTVCIVSIWGESAVNATDEKLVVLFVDDEENLLESFTTQFRKVFTVYVAESADAAKRMLQGIGGEVDVVVSDLRMPKESGLDFLFWLKENYPATSRILFSGYTDIDDALLAVNEIDVFRLLSKPCPMRELQDAIVRAGTASKEVRAGR